jgi:ribosomal protein S12
MSLHLKRTRKWAKRKKKKAHSVDELGTLENAKGICIKETGCRLVRPQETLK